MTVASSTTTSTTTPIFLEIGVNGDMQKAVNDKKPLSVILFDAYCPTKPLANQVFRHIVCPREPVSPEVTARYGITAEQAAQSPQFAAIWQQFREWAAPDAQTKVILVAHQFYKLSLKFLDAEAANAGVEVPSKWVKFDTSYLASFLDEFRDCGKDSLPEICTSKAISVTGNTGKDVHSLFTSMANPVPLENLYPLMLFDPKHPIKPVGDHLKQVQTVKKTSSAALRVIFFDLETTGLRDGSEEPHIVEISAFDPERNEYFTRLVNPEMFIPAEACRIHGITDDMVRTASKVNEMFAEFIPWAEKPINGAKPKVVMVGYNSASYDYPILTAEGVRGGIRVPSNWFSFDIFRLVNTLRIKSEPNRKLQTLREKFGIPPTQAHRAQGDTEVTYMLALKLFNNANTKDVYKEMGTPGQHPYIRVADIIRNTGGPAKFASGEDSVKPQETGKRKAAPKKAPVAELSASQDSDNEVDSPVVKRRRAPTTIQRVVSSAPNNDFAIKIAAQMAVEMAALLGATSSSATTVKQEEAQNEGWEFRQRSAPRRFKPVSSAPTRAPVQKTLPVLPVRKLIEDSDDESVGSSTSSEYKTKKGGKGRILDVSDSSTVEIV